MSTSFRLRGWRGAVSCGSLLALLWGPNAPAAETGDAVDSVAAGQNTVEEQGIGTAPGESLPAVPPERPSEDKARAQIGRASVYAPRFAGRRMADGLRLDPQSDSAASKTLPLGSSARVTNLANGQSAVVTIHDRGPYVKGRILDVSPGTAEKIGIGRNQGTTKVEVVPLGRR